MMVAARPAAIAAPVKFWYIVPLLLVAKARVPAASTALALIDNFRNR